MTPNEFLQTAIHAGRRRAITSPSAPHGTYPRVTHGYLSHCTKCGAEAAFYEVQSSVSNVEWKGEVSCQCRAEFDPRDPWVEGIA